MLLSAEQAHVVGLVRAGHNVSVTAVAGAGKSTTCFHAAQAVAPARTLVLCFNASLAATSTDRARALGLDTVVDCMTVHALASRMFGCAVHDSYVLQLMLARPTTTVTKQFDYGLVVLDEAQDLDDTLVGVVHMMCARNSTPTPQWLVVGDAAQEIYNTHKTNKLLDKPFVHLPSVDTAKWAAARLQDSYRLTAPMCTMLQQLFGCNISCATNDNPKAQHKPQFIIGNIHSGHLTQKILELLHTYAPDDMIVLAPSVRTAACGRLCLQLSADHNVPVYSSAQGSNRSDMRGKLVVSSFHQSKGLERKCVVVFGVGAPYQARWAAQANPLHVALTRAREQLVIFHHHADVRLTPFKDEGVLRDVCAVRVVQPEPPRSWPVAATITTKTTQQQNHNVNFAALVRFVPGTCIARLAQCIQVSKPKSLGRPAPAACAVIDTGESVAHLYEPAVLAAFAHHHGQQSQLLKNIMGLPPRTSACLPRYCQELLRALPPRNAAGWLCAAMIENAVAAHSMHVPHQVKSMAWVGDAENAHFVQCMQHLDVLARYLSNNQTINSVCTRSVADVSGPSGLSGGNTTVNVNVPLMSRPCESSGNDGTTIEPWLLTLALDVGEEHLWHAAFIMWALHVQAVRVFLVSKNEVVQIRTAETLSTTTLDALISDIIAHHHQQH